MDSHFTIAAAIFLVSFLAIVFDLGSKALISMSGALLMVVFGILTFPQAVAAIDLDTIGLLVGMMLMVDVVSDSGIFSLMSVKIAKFTKGKPWLIFVMFALITAVCSTFLNNVSVILVILPVVIALTRGIGLNPKVFVIATIFFSIIGGTLTLIGDPTNVIIGTSVGLGFDDFVANLYIPISIIAVVVGTIFLAINWGTLKPISHSLKQLFVSNLLLQKIEYEFTKTEISKALIAKIIVVFTLVLLGFVFGDRIGLNSSVVALIGAMLLFIVTTKNSSIDQSLSKAEWTTILFFVGLFIMVAGLEEAGVLTIIGNEFIGITDNFLYLLLILLWLTGIASMVVDNVAFATMMIPIVMQVQTSLPAGGPDHQLLWWAMVLGACLGGCGSPIGSSANVVALGIAAKNDCKISSFEYVRIAFPITILMLVICSLYFIVLLS